MSEPIRSDDFVVCVKGCPRCGYRLGMVFRVLAVRTPNGGGFDCGRCRLPAMHMGESAVMHSGECGVPLSWVKRIPPPEELGIVDEREELTA